MSTAPKPAVTVMSETSARRCDRKSPSTAPRATLVRRRPMASRRRPDVVLIVDDSVDTRELYAEYFRHRGMVAITAPDGDAGIDIAVQARPDVIVMDLAMPRVNGISAAHHLKHDPRTRKTPIILLTGYGFRAIHDGALEMGVDVFLTKPCLPEDLEAHLRRLLDQREAARRGPAGLRQQERAVRDGA